MSRHRVSYSDKQPPSPDRTSAQSRRICSWPASFVAKTVGKSDADVERCTPAQGIVAFDFGEYSTLRE